MLKVLSSEQVRQADKHSIQNEGISSLDLMERAATEAYKAIFFEIPLSNELEVSIFCGMGNNAGDGLVIGRLLSNADVKLKIFVLKTADKGSADFEVNLKRLKAMNVEINYLDSQKFSFGINPHSYIIDAIFGSGVNRAVKGFVKKVIQKINSLPNKVFSIDMPSGLFPEDNSNNDLDAIVQADETFCFESPRLSFFFPENHKYVGEFKVLPIGLDREFMDSMTVDSYYLEQADVVKMLRKRKAFEHKGSYGHSLIYAGSYGKVGAAVLSARACLRSGTGLLSMRIPDCAYSILQTAVPESMVEVDDKTEFLSQYKEVQTFSAIGIGPGIGTNKQTAQLLKKVLQNSGKPIVLDADALNILSENKSYLSLLGEHCLLTPHPGEFKRLVGEWKNDFERYQMHREFAMKYKIYMLLKGKFSALACPDGSVYFNPTGNPGMASGGSGDVLTGMLVSLLAQAYTVTDAALLGMYLHGLAGDLAVMDKTEYSLIASDIIDYIPKAYEKLEDLELNN